MKKTYFLILYFITAYIFASHNTKINSVVNDTETPIVSCPENILASSNDGSITTVNYASPLFTDNSLVGTFSISDGQEINGFTKIGTHNNHTYYISNSSDTYQNFKSNLSSINAAFPVTINNEAENKFIANYLQDNSIASVQIGFTDEETEGSFSWENGEAVNYTNWNFNEPNNANAGEDFTQMFASGYWNDVDTSILQIVIEVPFISEQIAGLPSGVSFPIGITTNTFRVNDGFGNIATCSFDVNLSEVIHVKADASGNNDGSSWENAFVNLQDALASANNGDNIWVAAGTYKPSSYPSLCNGCNLPEDFTFELKAGVSLYGGFAGTENLLSERNIINNTTILNGVLPSGTVVNHVIWGVFSNTSSINRLDGFTINNGNADANPFRSLIINGITGTHTDGGGLAIYGGQNIIANNTFTNNSAFRNGGAIFINGGINIIENNNMSSNSAYDDGGGIYISNGTNTLKNNIISSNSANVEGGGVSIINSTNSLSKNQISGNTAQFGGGAFFANSNNTLVNNLLSGNSSAYASSIYSNNCTNIWTNNTIYGNNGFYSGTLTFTIGSNTLNNNIIWGNNGLYTYNGAGGSLTITNSIIESEFPGVGNIVSNPLFINQSNGNFKLQNTSPAINGGNNTSYQNATNTDPVNDTDLEGLPRLVGNNIDMGAFESSVICVPDDASFNYTSSSYCKNASDPTPNITGLTGGTFSSGAGLSLNASTGSIDVSESSTGTYTITYTTLSSCPNSSTVSITINDVDDSLFFYYNPSSFCENSSDPTPLTFESLDGAYSSTTGLSLNPSTGKVDISESVPGTYTVTHTTSGVCPNISTSNITIRSLPSVSFTAPSQLYLSDGIQTGLGGGIPQGVGFTYGFYSGPGVTDDGNGTTYTFDPAAAGEGTHTITYLFSDEYFCESTASDTIEVLPICLPSYINSCFQAIFIDSFALNTINNSSSGCFTNSYTDYYSTISTDLIQGSTYNISFTPGSFIAQYFAVWIDFNQDADFDEDNEFFDIGIVNPGTTFTTPISIPTNLASGNIRLRVMSRLGSLSISQTDYCSTSLFYGETEDYSVVIKPGNEWTGAEDTNWSNANNWSETSVPGATDYAVIKATTNQPIINAATTAEISSLFIEPSSTLKVQGVLKVEEEINNTGEITFESNATGTGQLDEFAGRFIGTGTAVVEQFIPAGTNAKRAFRFLASPVNTTNSIRTNWQENASSNTDNPNPGFGTHITGTLIDGTDGFDATNSGSPSLLVFDNATQNWSAIDNTDVNTLEVGNAYNLFVRGDRSIDLTNSSQTPTNTVLRATGDLVTGDFDVSSNLATGAGEFNFIGNPYQSIINVNSLTKTNMVSGFYWAWDPNINSASGGAYVAVELPLGNNIIGSVANQFVMPGQSFFVRNLLSNPTLEFTESAKDVTATATSIFSENEEPKIDMKLYDDQGFTNGDLALDALGIRFKSNGNNAVDFDDAPKLANPGDNFARQHNNDFLTIENRALPLDNEELSLAIWNHQFTNYTFSIDVLNFETQIDVYLVDAYLNTETLLQDNQNIVSFTIDSSIPESLDLNRFSLKFDNTTLSVNDNAFADGFSLYPNPTDDGLFSIKTQGLNNGDVQIKIFNLTGQEVLNKNFKSQANGEISLNAVNLSSGVYMVELSQNSQSFKTKLIIK